MSKFTITHLKKQLSQKTKADLIKEITGLCQKFPQVKEYYKGSYGEVEDLSKKYKNIIRKEFIATPKTFPKARYSVARKAVNDFKKLTGDMELIADMMLTYVEVTSSFNSEYGPDGEDSYIRPENMFEKTLAFMKKNALLDTFRPRAYQIVIKATEGWGHRDSLEDTFIQFYGELSR